MISIRKLIGMARKWQKKAAAGRKRISFTRNNLHSSSSAYSSSLPRAEKGHVAVYMADQKRYSFPIAYLKNCIIRELFRMAEEEFGLPGDGPIRVPCEAEFMDYLISLIQRRATKDIEKALLVSISGSKLSSFYPETNSQHPVPCF